MAALWTQQISGALYRELMGISMYMTALNNTSIARAICVAENCGGKQDIVNRLEEDTKKFGDMVGVFKKEEKIGKWIQRILNFILFMSALLIIGLNVDLPQKKKNE